MVTNVRFDVKLAVAIGAAVVFAASAFPGIEAGLTAYAPGPLALLRFLTASVLLIAYVAIARPPLPKPAIGTYQPLRWPSPSKSPT